MVVLALETVTRAGSVALADGDEVVSRLGDPSRTHGERLPAEILDLVTTRGLSVPDVDRLAIVSGPGSFTGLRVGMATVQGLAAASDRLVVQVPTLDALLEAGDDAVRDAPVAAAILDGQRGEVFAAAYRRTSDGTWTTVLEPIVDRPAHAVEAIRRVAGGDRVAIIGLGVESHLAAWAALTDTIVTPALPLAGAAARIAMRDGAVPVRPHALQPIYVRRPDAEIARARHRAAGQDGDDGWQVDLARAHDLAAIEALQRRAFVRPWADGSLRSEVATSPASRLYVLRAADHVVAGYCACWMIADELHINSIAIDEPFRRRGLGTRLLRAVCRDARQRGARMATLEVRESNRAARALYERLGFRVEGVRRNYYETPREDAVILWLRSLASLR